MSTTTVFESPTALGAKIITISTTITNTSGAYSATITDERLTASMKAIKLELGDPSVFDAVINVAVNNGSLTITCASVTGTSTAVISVLKTCDDPTAITTTEFDVLANRIDAVDEDKVSYDISNTAYTTGSMDDLPTGLYRIYAAVTEKPEANNGYASCIYRGDGTKLQHFVSDSNKTYTRIKQNDEWGQWNGLATDSELSAMSAGNYQSGTLTLNVKKYPAIFFFKGDGNNYTGTVAILGANMTMNIVTPSGFTVSISNGVLTCGNGYFYWGIIY